MIHTNIFKFSRPIAPIKRAQAAIKIIAFAMCCGTLLFAGQSVANALPAVITGTVTRVIDGDTIWVQISSGSKPLKVRLHAIDAPEICQAGGMASSNALREHVFGKTVTLRPQTTDRYSRTVAIVDLQGHDISRWAVRNGHAWATGYFKSARPYLPDQDKAQYERRGMFASTGRSEHPKEFRKRHGSCFSHW